MQVRSLSLPISSSAVVGDLGMAAPGGKNRRRPTPAALRQSAGSFRMMAADAGVARDGVVSGARGWTSTMAGTSERLLICAIDELATHRSAGITHLVAVTNPTQAIPPPSWFGGQFLAVG